jgi:preprotein translocase subunit Sec61beta
LDRSFDRIGGWRPIEALEPSAVGQNLTDHRDGEFGPGRPVAESCDTAQRPREGGVPMAMRMERMKGNRARVSRAGVVTLAVGLAATLFSGSAPAEPAASEYEVKAAFLLNFARLVEWPKDAFSDAGSSFGVGLLGTASASEQIQQFLEGKSIGSHTVHAQQIESADEAAGFHMVFVGASSGAEVGEVAAAIGGGPVLLVGESEGFATSGGAINFFTEGNKIRFEINPRAAEAAGLRVSSRLLRVAKIISDG